MTAFVFSPVATTSHLDINSTTMSDLSGNYGRWKVTAIRANNQAAQSMLKHNYKKETT
ncbi:putative proteasome endopeptidase complex [Dioscorea sansibarensis]